MRQASESLHPVLRKLHPHREGMGVPLEQGHLGLALCTGLSLGCLLAPAPAASTPQ